MASPDDLIRFGQRLRTFPSDLAKARDLAEERSAKVGAGIGRKYSKGGYSQASLNLLNNPYGWGRSHSLLTRAENPSKGPKVRGPIPYGDPSIINFQSGDFYRAWEGVKVGGVYCVVNRTREASFMAGTVFMIGRPIRERVERELLAVRQENLKNYLAAVKL